MKERIFNRITMHRVEQPDDTVAYKIDLYSADKNFLIPIVHWGFDQPVVNALTDWCMDHLDIDDWTFVMNGPDQPYDFEFGSEEIALAFKLRWDETTFDDPFHGR